MAVITLSRHFGSGGITLCTRVAKKLRYVFLNEEKIQLAAFRMRTCNWKEVVEKQYDGKLLSWISSLVPDDRPEKFLDDKIREGEETISGELLQDLLLQIAEAGDAIIVGSGGQYLLRDHKDAVHVLLVADLEDRVQFMEERYNLSLKKALQVVSREDKRRQNFYRLMGKTDYDQPDIYHLVLNMSMLSIESASELLITLINGVSGNS